MFTRLFVAGVFLALTLSAGQAHSQALPAGVVRVQSVEGVTEYRLANGLTILLAPDQASTTATVNVTYFVGSRHEGYGETGMAHLLEHLVFKGTPATPDPKAEFRKRGFTYNGTTNADRTNYFASFTSTPESLDFYIGWQADAMTNSFISRKDLDSEMSVVRNEFEIGENNPTRVLSQRLASVAYQWHNYGKSTIGARSDIENVDIASLQAFYRRYYRPDNAMLMVHGKFDVAQLLATAQAKFGPIAKPAAPLRKTYTLDPVQDGERSVTVRRPGTQQIMIAAYHTVPRLHPDNFALSALTYVMAEAPGGRLQRLLVDKSLAQTAFADPGARKEAGLISFGIGFASDADAAERQKLLLDTLEGIALNPVTQAEFDRAKLRLEREIDQLASSAASMARITEYMAVMGDWRAAFTQRERLSKLTLADVNRVAQTYLVASNRSLGLLVPTDKPVRAPEPAFADVAKYMQGAALKEAGEALSSFDYDLATLGARAPRGKTPGGIDLAVANKEVRGDRINFTLTARVGNEASLKGREMAAAVYSAMLSYGTTKTSREGLADARAKLGLTGGMGYRLAAGNANWSVKRENFEQALALTAEVMREPALTQTAFDQVKARLLGQTEGLAKDPSTRARVEFQRYGQPYKRGEVRYIPTPDESIEELKALSLEDVRRYHQDVTGAHAAVATVIGRIGVQEATALVAKYFDGWKAPQPYARVGTVHYAATAARLVYNTPDKANASLLSTLSLPMREDDKDYPALVVATRIFGAGSGSRLWDRLREKGGLSYTVGASFTADVFDPRASWTMRAEVAPENLSKAEAAMREELARSLQDGFSPDEVKRGINTFLEDRKRERSNDAWLGGAMNRWLLADRSYAYSLEYEGKLSKLTAQEVNAAWRKYVVQDKLVWGVFADEKKAK